MSKDLYQKVSACLQRVSIPGMPGSLIAEQASVGVEEGKAQIRLELGYPCKLLRATIEREIRELLSKEGIACGSIHLEQKIPSLVEQQSSASIQGVKNIVAVASGKGGVGKSTTSVNLALALAYEGAKVAILDADIYGPSQPQMLGVGGQRPEMHAENMIEPIETHGIKVISMGNLITENTPMVWRGPMVSGALQQLIKNTHWGDVDYLIVDMPPGTGDIQLTLSQSVPVSGAVIVTTPQDIALLDAKKAIEMFRKVNIPVTGVVENMAVHTCSNCGHKEAIFGADGGKNLASEFAVELLGMLPLHLDIRLQTDEGRPPLVADPDSDISQIYRQIARSVAAHLWQLALSGEQQGPQISIEDD